MDKDLIVALEHLHQARDRLRPHFSKHCWPVFYEDIDYIIKAIRDIQLARSVGVRLPR